MELIVATLIGLFILREYVTYKERQKLLDRIMSRNYQEFKDIETPEDNDFGNEEESLEVEDAIEEARGEIDGKE